MPFRDRGNHSLETCARMFKRERSHATRTDNTILLAVDALSHLKPDPTPFPMDDCIDYIFATAVSPYFLYLGYKAWKTYMSAKTAAVITPAWMATTYLLSERMRWLSLLMYQPAAAPAPSTAS